MEEQNLRTLLTVSVFIILFMSIGWMSPALHATHAPDDRFLEVNQFEPANATVNSDSHTICWDRDVHYATTGEVIMELYLLDEDGVEREIDTSVFRSYFETDAGATSFQMPFPDGTLEEGEYQYQAIVTMQLADGRVERTFTYESETFYLKSNTTDIDPYTLEGTKC